MDLIVRKYVDDDYEYVDKLLFDIFHYHKEKVSDSKVFEFVGCIGNQIVGYFNIMEEIDVVRNMKIYHVGYVCIDSRYQGQGFGKKLMEYAIQFAKKNHVKRIELTSSNQREIAHRLYFSLGFKKRDTSVFRKELV